MMMNTESNKEVTLSGKDLKAIANLSKTAEVVTYALGLRKRLRTFSDITRMKYQLINEGHKIVEEDYKKFWEYLANAGMGVIVYGRNGKRDRFVWYYNMRSVAEAALEGHDVKVVPFKMATDINTDKSTKPKLEKVAKEVRRRIKKTHAEAAKTTDSNGTKHIFVPLRNDVLEFKLPNDITKAEMENIFKVLRKVA